MALKARIKANEYSTLSAAIQAEYKVADDGDYVIDVVATDGWDLQNIAGLTSTLQKQKNDLQTARGLLKQYELDGEPLDPKAAAEAITKLKKLGSLDPEQLASEKVKVALGQQQEQFNKALSTKEQEAKSLLQQLEQVLIDQAATAALAGKGGNIKLLLPHVKSNARLVKTDSGFQVQVVGNDGNPRIKVANGQTVDMTLEQLVEEMASSDDYAAAFAAQSRSGGATPPGAGGAGGAGRPRVISSADSAALSNNLEAIAKGQVQVAIGQ